MALSTLPDLRSCTRGLNHIISLIATWPYSVASWTETYRPCAAGKLLVFGHRLLLGLDFCPTLPYTLQLHTKDIASLYAIKHSSNV
jgi:hypothetical protein